ncbi:MAG: hypothetical protein ACI9MC_000819 [Kiritimatiellia bacterium]|jgi:hypothetical protein
MASRRSTLKRLLYPSVVLAMALAACNTVPSTFRVAIGPAEATSAEELRVEFWSEARDSNEVSYTYAWFVDGTQRTELTGMVVAADQSKKGEIWRVEVTPNDGKADGPTASAEITILNSPPTAEIQAEFVTLKSTDELVASATSDDPDGDTTEIIWYWTRDGHGTQFNTPKVSAAATYPGEIWIAHAVPFDGDAKGEAATIEIEILNGEPVIDSVTIDPQELYADLDVKALVTAWDPDRQPVTLDYTWEVNGSIVATGDKDGIPSSFFKKHDEVSVTVVASDTVDLSSPSNQSITVLNALPTAPDVTIEPEEPIPTIDDMTCAIVLDSTDRDDEDVKYRFEWTVDGAKFTGAISADNPGDTIHRDDYSDDEEWKCIAIPYDSDDDGPSAHVEIIPVTWKGIRSFGTCKGAGNKGPKQSKCDGDDGYKNTTLNGEVTIDEGIQQWTVPVDGKYRITANGAQGSASTYSPYKYRGGYGTILRGDFDLKRGDVIHIAVGHKGQTDGYGAGGGGATWVMMSDDTPLLVAGGGGSTTYYASYYGRVNGCNATTSSYGITGSATGNKGYCTTKRTSLGDGGAAGYNYGSGGGGYNSDGKTDTYPYSPPKAGESWKNGALGGAATSAGGFGGGGGGASVYRGGGGGGYSGGDAGRHSGGGGSINKGSSQTNSVGNTGDGAASIDLISF